MQIASAYAIHVGCGYSESFNYLFKMTTFGMLAMDTIPFREWI